MLFSYNINSGQSLRICPDDLFFLYGNQLILVSSETDLHCMGHTASPLRIRMSHMEMVVMLFISMFLKILTQDALLDRRHLVAQIRAGHIQSHGIKGRQHTHIGDNGNIIFRMAVAVR